jgi:RNA polymerase sigma-70 factor (ECF subfamily)
MLTEDAAISMPPLASWFGPRDVMAEFLAAYPMSGVWRWRTVRTTANGQPALGFYAWDEPAQAYLPFALNVLSFRGRQVKDVTAFVVRTTEVEREDQFHRWVEVVADPAAVERVFTRFGLPDSLSA